MTGFRDGSGVSWVTCKQSAPRSRQTTTPTPHHSVFAGRMHFLTPNQQCQSTEGASRGRNTNTAVTTYSYSNLIFCVVVG